MRCKEWWSACRCKTHAPIGVVGDGAEIIFMASMLSKGAYINQWPTSDSYGARLPTFLQEEGMPCFFE